MRALAEATLALVLFCDASRIDFRLLRREVGVPVRLLGIGLPLTIALGGLVAAGLFDQLSVEEAAILAIVLAPTDAALGQAVVTEPRVPERIRQGLNVESGLNDGICVPLLFAAVAVADVESEISEGRSAATLLLEEIGLGVVGGVVGGVLVAMIVIHAGRRDLIAGRGGSDPWRRRGVRLRHGKRPRWLGVHRRVRRGDGLPARARARPRTNQRPQRGSGERAQRRHLRALRGDLLGPALRELSWELALYAVLSLTVLRMLPVALAMLGSHARAPTVGFFGWFGPRGLASIVFAVIVIEESSLPHEHLIVLAIYLTVGCRSWPTASARPRSPTATPAGTSSTRATSPRRWRARRPMRHVPADQ